MHARNYRNVKNRKYTQKRYMKGFPPPKITKFTMGDTSSKFEYEVKLIALKKAQVRHNALEAGRIATNRVLGNKLLKNYCLKIFPYPHIILRENKMIFGAHADRISDGMRRSFGRPIGTAASIKANQKIMAVKVNKEGIETAKEALRIGKSKFSMPCKIIINETQK